MDKQCVAYVSDIEYVFPTIASALMARKFTRQDTDICILMSQPISNFSDIYSLLKDRGIALIDVSESLGSCLARLDSSHFQRRISKTAMGKLVLHEILPSQYNQVIYLDGDTQIVSTLEELEAVSVPSGKFLAARDYLAVTDLLTVGHAGRYFNSGVLKFNREGWIGREALEAFITDPEACGGLHDQGALNYVGGSSLILISNRWNFPKQYLHLVKMSSLKVVHYMAHPKPWHGTFFPWTAAETIPYRQLREDHLLFAELHRGIGMSRKAAYKIRSAYERVEYLVGRRLPDSRAQALLVGDYLI
jgi:lipopolysaccharide biosynthesis glycosyltransferase